MSDETDYALLFPVKSFYIYSASGCRRIEPLPIARPDLVGHDVRFKPTENSWWDGEDRKRPSDLCPSCGLLVFVGEKMRLVQRAPDEPIYFEQTAYCMTCSPRDPVVLTLQEKQQSFRFSPMHFTDGSPVYGYDESSKKSVLISQLQLRVRNGPEVLAGENMRLNITLQPRLMRNEHAPYRAKKKSSPA